MQIFDSSDEAAIIDRVLAGDRAAYRALVERYGPRMYSFCLRRIGSEDEARDLAQEVFIRAWKSLRGFRKDKSFTSWLFAIAANQIRNVYRTRSSEQRKVEAAGVQVAASQGVDPTDEVHDSLDAEALRAAVGELPDDMKESVSLYYFGGLSVAQAAQALGVGEEAVKSRLFRARNLLRKKLESMQPGAPGRGIR
jgi:RNA polymerase sigma-70 factor (ECF subfamily)